MSQRKYLTVMVIRDDMAEHRQFKIAPRTIKLAVTTFILCAFAAVTFGYLWANEYSETSAIAKLEDENQQLKLANERYLSATIEIEKKLKLFDEKTTKLATLVGVDANASVTGGLGGATYFDNELSRYLRYDLSLVEQKSTIVEQRIEDLDEAFKTQKELLDATPSLLPAKGWLVSGFAYRTDPFTKKKTWHNGLDISCPQGTPVYAPADGVVSRKGYHGGFGNLLQINHGNGIETKYGHLSKFNVTKGQRVQRGDLIGYVGTTGRSTGPHLHFEIHSDDKAVDPMKYIIEDIKPY